MLVTESPPSVADGALFTDPGPLPRGRRGLSREQVQAAQRERLLIAVTELLAAHGYRGFGPGEIAEPRRRLPRRVLRLLREQGGVRLRPATTGSSRCCWSAGELRLTTTGKAAGDAGTTRSCGTYLETLASDLVVARAYQVEIDALGPPSARAAPQCAQRLRGVLPRAQRARLTPERASCP